MPIYNQKDTNKKTSKKLFFVIVFIFIALVVFKKPIYINKEIYIGKNDTVYEIYKDFGFVDKLTFMIYLKTHSKDLGKLKIGTYIFSGSYTHGQIIEKLNNGPDKTYLKVTIIEGRSKYDIDYFLSSRGYIKTGDYISFVDDKVIVDKYKKRYSFLNSAKIKSLEGFLYPETYFLDYNGDIVDKIVYLQLETFKKKVFDSSLDIISTFPDRLKNFYKGVSLDFYDAVILASIVQKEDGKKQNMKYIGGVFLNRIYNSMRLDADISLCYGLKLPYRLCTNDIISQNIDDKSNKYNTRANTGLPPTPIGNPTYDAIVAIVNFEKNDYFYYLHDKSGQIHLSKNIQEHNLAKSKYLNN